MIAGCPKCAEKAKNLLGGESYTAVEDGTFAIVSRAMSEIEAEAALADSGLEILSCLPVLD